MSLKEIEVSLRVPNMKVRVLDQHGYPLDHATVRFVRLVQVPAIPKPGESLQLPMGSDAVFQATVTRAAWHDEKGLFVVACQYGQKRITAEEYAALTGDPAWTLKPLS